MGTNYYAVKSTPTVDEPIHIGKSSMGWKFLFHEYEDTWHDPPIVWHTFNQIKAWLEEYVEQKKEYVILDEYDRNVSLSEFLDIVKYKQEENNKDDFTYAKNVDGYRFVEGWFS